MDFSVDGTVGEAAEAYRNTKRARCKIRPFWSFMHARKLMVLLCCL